MIYIKSLRLNETSVKELESLGFILELDSKQISLYSVFVVA